MNVANMIPVNMSLVILLMIAVNGIIFGVCVCRLMKMHDVLVRVKIQYVIGMVVSAANGLSPILFQQWPNSVGLMFAVWVCYTLLSDGYQWKDGPPPSTIVKKECNESKAE